MIVENLLIQQVSPTTDSIVLHPTALLSRRVRTHLLHHQNNPTSVISFFLSMGRYAAIESGVPYLLTRLVALHGDEISQMRAIYTTSSERESNKSATVPKISGYTTTAAPERDAGFRDLRLGRRNTQYRSRTLLQNRGDV